MLEEFFGVFANVAHALFGGLAVDEIATSHEVASVFVYPVPGFSSIDHTFYGSCVLCVVYKALRCALVVSWILEKISTGDALLALVVIDRALIEEVDVLGGDHLVIKPVGFLKQFFVDTKDRRHANTAQ